MSDWLPAFDRTLKNLPNGQQITDELKNRRRLCRYEILCAKCRTWKCECSYAPRMLRNLYAMCRTCVSASRKQRYHVDIDRSRLKNRAYYAVRMALKSGALTRKPCEVCGDTESETHHADYTRPLDVRWRCKKHHPQLHRL